MPTSLTQILEHELLPGERLVWQVRSCMGSRVWASLGIFIYGMSIFLFSVVLVWAVGSGVAIGCPSIELELR